MKVILLGSGSPSRLPALGCDCRNCQEAWTNDTKRRTTTSLLVRGDVDILLDAGPDLRLQLVRERIRTVDAIFITHCHFDHVLGVEAMRPIRKYARKKVPVFAPHDTIGYLRSVFGYMVKKDQIELRTISAGETIRRGNLHVLAFAVFHTSDCATVGYIVEQGHTKIGYIPDASSVPAESFSAIRGCEILYVSALKQAPTPTHTSWAKAIEIGRDSQAHRIVLVHISHSASVSETLSSHVVLGFDGYTVDL